MNRNDNIRPMTSEEKASFEARKRAWQEKRNAEKAIRDKKRKKLILAAIFAVVLLAVSLSAALIISGSLGKADQKAPKSYTFRIGDDRVRVPYRDAQRDGMLCINMRLLKDILYLTESNSRPGVVTFTSRSSGSSVIFTNGSNIAVVNGQNIKLPIAAVIESELCSVPLETVALIFNGINVEVAGGRVTITQNNEVIDICAKSTDPLNMIIEFKADVSGYEEYMDPQGEKRDSFLLLVNKQNPLGSTYTPRDLVKLGSEYCINESADFMERYAAEAAKAMLKELWASTGNKNIIGTSGYRSYERQKMLFERYIGEEAAKPENAGKTTAELEAVVVKYSARPGTSEHQSGLCLDLIDTTRGDVQNYQDTGCFTSVSTYNWLRSNAWKFGFILRYPSDKVDITGYEYESWHYRYVGRYHAEKMYRSGQTLDEYIADMNSNG